MNLVGNAIKFTAQGEVVVEVIGRTIPEPGGGHRLRWSSPFVTPASGSRAEKQAAIFRAFEQEDSSTTRKYGGTGLGLTISAQLAALMGGEITVRERAGAWQHVRASRLDSPALRGRPRSPRPVARAARGAPRARRRRQRERIAAILSGVVDELANASRGRR